MKLSNLLMIVSVISALLLPATAMSSNMTSGSQPSWQEGQAPGPAYGQWQGRLSPEDQRYFDQYYAKWQDATRRNDRDDINNNARKMQDIMTRYNIPPDVPFDQIASNSAYPQTGAYGNAYPGAYPASPVRLSPDDQQKLNKAYQKWLDATRKNDSDDINNNARKMQDIMAKYNIPSNVPFDQVASGSPIVIYPNGTYAAGQWQGRLSADHQRDFDKAYSKWVDASRNNDQQGIQKHAREMQDIMARYNIPPNVPFNQIASGAYPGNAAYPPAATYPPTAYPGAYPAGQWQGRLSADDQQKFDKYYNNWVKATNKNDRDDIDSNARHMQDIMARYNIPANVPFAQIASPDATQH
ncbi:MAG TPA: hypothetical protein VEV41_15980 [Terriglobales bacterium]|nr:hypothetical protein [Terriglobales bacterium]